ncbi:Protein of unknown function DUF599 [Dillenia turbinata]|uniref:DUF599 domain-containing protein n=1 Tax=Dillenia turbinata TaxID=194707 RepID=A0AAN8ZML0_9MAGN
MYLMNDLPFKFRSSEDGLALTMGVLGYLDTILVPLSLFLTFGYHVYLWPHLQGQSFINYCGRQRIEKKKMVSKLEFVTQGDDKKGMLAVQSLRNTLMTTILMASIAIMIDLILAALTNNSYNASHLLKSSFFGSQVSRITILKYGSASLFLIISFMCSSMSVGCLVDANFLINAASEHEFSQPGIVQIIFERGFLLAVVGNRMLCMAFPLLVWLYSPVMVILSSVALVLGLYHLDFPGSFTKFNKKILLA